ncbi:MAG: prefoldin subunit alpha [Candidatus Thorarchaeota archaeon]|jgi:prefoldin alpha subunit
MTEEQQNLLQQLYLEQQRTESNLNAIRQQIELTQVLLNQYQNGFAVLKELEARNEGEETLVNVGGGIFVQAKLMDTSKVTRALGSGVRIEQSLEQAIEGVEQAIENLGKQYESLLSELSKVANRSEAIDAQMRQLATQMQAQGAQ